MIHEVKAAIQNSSTLHALCDPYPTSSYRHSRDQSVSPLTIQTQPAWPSPIASHRSFFAKQLFSKENWLEHQIGLRQHSASLLMPAIASHFSPLPHLQTSERLPYCTTCRDAVLIHCRPRCVYICLRFWLMLKPPFLVGYYFLDAVW